MVEGRGGRSTSGEMWWIASRWLLQPMGWRRTHILSPADAAHADPRPRLGHARCRCRRYSSSAGDTLRDREIHRGRETHRGRKIHRGRETRATKETNSRLRDTDRPPADRSTPLQHSEPQTPSAAQTHRHIAPFVRRPDPRQCPPRQPADPEVAPAPSPAAHV